MQEEYVLDTIFEMLEQKRKKIIEKHKGSFDILKEKLNDIENERIQVVKGNKKVIKKIINENKKV